MKKKLFTIISMVLIVVIVVGMFLPYYVGAKQNLWQSFGNAFAIAGVCFSVIGFLGCVFKKNELNYLVCGYFLGTHIYILNEVITAFELQATVNPNAKFSFSMLSLGFYVQIGGAFLLLLTTFVSSFFDKKEKVVAVEGVRNNTQVQTTVNNGQMNMPVNSFKSLPVQNKEEEKTMPKPDLLSGVKQNNDSLFVNSNLFVNNPATNPQVNTGPSLLDHITVPNSPPGEINGNGMPMMTMSREPNGVMAPPVAPEANSMPAGMIAPPEPNGVMASPAAPAANSMPAGMMAPPEPNGMMAPPVAPAANSMPAGMIAPPEPNGMMAPPAAPEVSSMSTGMMAPPEPNGVMAPPAPEVNSMPTGMMAPPEPNGLMAPPPAAPEANSMPTGLMAPPEPNGLMAPPPAAPEANSMPTGMMGPPEPNGMMAPPAAPEVNSMPTGLMAPPEPNGLMAPPPAVPEANSMPAGMMAPPEPNGMMAPPVAPEANSMPEGMMVSPELNSIMPPSSTQELNSMPQSMMAGPAPVESQPLSGILGGLPQPSQEGGADIKTLMNEGPSVEEQLKQFNAAQQAHNSEIPKPDLLAGSNLSGVLGNGDSNGNNLM